MNILGGLPTKGKVVSGLQPASTLDESRVETDDFMTRSTERSRVGGGDVSLVLQFCSRDDRESRRNPEGFDVEAWSVAQLEPFRGGGEGERFPKSHSFTSRGRASKARASLGSCCCCDNSGRGAAQCGWLGKIGEADELGGRKRFTFLLG